MFINTFLFQIGINYYDNINDFINKYDILIDIFLKIIFKKFFI